MMSVEFLYDNADKYQKILDDVVMKIDEGEGQYKQLKAWADPVRARVAMSVLPRGSENNKRFDLVYPADEDGEAEEVVLTLQGYIVDGVLPPVFTKHELPRKIENARQRVKLSGLGSDSFEQATQAVLQIHQTFGSHLPPSSLLSSQLSTERTFLTLEFMNRYFTLPGEVAIGEDLQLSDAIDPYNILRNGKGDAKHTTDNEVLYYERKVIPDSSQEFKYEQISPVMIQAGNLVEVQVGFCTVQLNRGRFLMLQKLRSICVLSRIVEQDMNKVAIEKLKQQQHVQQSKRVKRTVGYGDDAIVVSTKKFKKMRIENEETN